MGALKIVTANVNGINNLIKRKKIMQILKKIGDIIFIQETHLCKEEHEKLGKLIGAQIFATSYTSAKRGVTVLLNNSLGFVKDKCIRDREGRYVFVQGEIDAQAVTLINVYNPPGEDVAFMKRILHLLMSETRSHVHLSTSTFPLRILSYSSRFGFSSFIMSVFVIYDTAYTV
uniref:Endonuclease/exonuclease/phosphatase domain-containing protein n=1 Tax=Acanthochromis polyacanthus TaxID=80966 RepID=A0A3Q1FIG0_9TELE